MPEKNNILWFASILLAKPCQSPHIKLKINQKDPPMEQIIATIAEKIGVSPELASKAVGIILNLVDSSVSDDVKDRLYGFVPEAKELAAAGGEQGGGGLMGMAGGLFGGGGGAMGAMAAMGKLSEAGLDNDQIGSMGKTLLGYIGEVGDEELVGEIVSSIPGLDRFI